MKIVLKTKESNEEDCREEDKKKWMLDYDNYLADYTNPNGFHFSGYAFVLVLFGTINFIWIAHYFKSNEFVVETFGQNLFLFHSWFFGFFALAFSSLKFLLLLYWSLSDHDSLDNCPSLFKTIANFTSQLYLILTFTVVLSLTCIACLELVKSENLNFVDFQLFRR